MQPKYQMHNYDTDYFEHRRCQPCKLISSDTEAEAEKQFIANTITMGYREAQEGHFAGKGLSSLDTLVEELRAEAE